MKRVIGSLLAVAVVAALATGALIWRLTRDPAPKHPEISAYSHGQLVRVGPYRYCDVFKITTCDVPETVGQLSVTSRDPVQLSVPPAIARAPWVLIRAYEGNGDSAVDEFRPGARIAVTIPTVDPRRGRLTGIAVQLPTLVRDEAGNEFPWPHAEWSVATVWS
ncbi:hypothetical protein MMAD_46220 [Mycolicibacterium madagascariense]|uniref:DUF2771 domain-containing protein n=1 Tax=Mycolicibacterium madagascariense TaxID=212765 RepID=A0A7I7XM87_9MYCO|nr:DUF2771 domain-containing protein [Mycolicibacterium madagascariense]MCV7012646.1 DUF2771 domain-containing protein [Mycolicibacterium madagascariense]BBZ30327.1 hypothetical protein MMAD_46220 [Mycolicibacterium madagascariense]